MESFVRAASIGSYLRKFLKSDFIDILWNNNTIIKAVHILFCNNSSMSETIKVVVRVRPMNQK
jgi:hypothetical protein